MATRTKNAKEIFGEAIEQYAPSQWPEFLHEACGSDASLRQRVEVLLNAHIGDGSLLDRPAIAPAPTLDQPAEQLGSQIGPYKLLEQIGEGGMGLVYMAEQQRPVKRLVALKLIKPGMDTKQVIARFEAERQALAMMDHPNIARIYDAGTTGEVHSSQFGARREDAGAPAAIPQSAIRNPHLASSGRPYFAMELVRGLPVTDFCDQKHFAVRQRLELFTQVCMAVQHAHQKGIIHRDLKPTNVLITLADSVPVPKVIDFGIAKALGQSLTDHTLHTGYSQLVGTPLYMSPEQAEMNLFGVDTRSDVYSLGVMLYELLTGTTPFEKERLKSVTFDEMRRIIREEEPETVSARIAKTKSRVGSAHQRSRHTPCAEPPSSLAPSHQPLAPRLSELDWIVMKALEKDRSRRYESASALAADIQRYLSDEPVLACPPTTMYRFQKFARKHKPSLITAAAIAACLLVGTTVSAWQAVRATQAEAQATVNQQKAVANEAQAKAAAAAEATQRQRAEANEQQANTERDEAQRQRDEVKALADKLAAKEDELQRTLYADHIYMAKEAWDSGNVARATDLLKRHLPKPDEPDRRGFEWHYLNRLMQFGPLISINTGLGISGPHNPRLSPDRKRLFHFNPGRTIPGGTTATQRIINEPTLKVWNLQTGQEVFTAILPGAGSSAAFNPDGTRLVTGAGRPNSGFRDPAAGNLKVWDTQTGKEILSGTGARGEMAFSANNQLLASPWQDRTLKVFNLQTGEERWSLKVHSDEAHALALSPDGRRLASASNTWDKNKDAYVAGDIKVWDLQTGEELWTFGGITKWISLLAFSSDGQRLASAQEGTIKLWNVQTGEAIKTFQWDFWSASELVFSPDDTRLIGYAHKQEQGDWVFFTKMWNTQSGQDLLSFKNCYLSFAPDGKHVAAEDSERSRTKVFDAHSGQQIMNISGTRPTFSPDSKRLAVKSDGLRIWVLETGDEINHIKSDTSARTLAFSLDGGRLIGNNGSLGTQVWDVEARQERSKTLTLHGLNRQSYSVGSPALFNSDFTRLAGISYRKIKIFDGESGQELRTLAGHENNVSSVAISSDGKRVASSDGGWLLTRDENPGAVKVWDADTGSELFIIKGHERSIGFLTFSPDGKKLAGSASDRTVKIWDAQSGRELHTLGAMQTRFNSWCKLAFSPDSKRLAGVGKIWDVETGEELVTLKGAAEGSVSFSPNGKCVAGRGRGVLTSMETGRRATSGFLDTVWDAQTGEVLFTIPDEDSKGGHASLTFSPDGKRLASSDGIWDAQTGLELFSFDREDRSGHVFFSADGHRLAVVRSRGTEVTIYDATPLPEKP